MCETTACIGFAGIFIFGILMGFVLGRKVLSQADKSHPHAGMASNTNTESVIEEDRNRAAPKQLVEHQLDSTEDKNFLTDFLTTMVAISLFFILILSLEA